MAPKKWELKKEDMTIAYLYISRGLKSDKMYSHRDYDAYIKARDEFHGIVSLYGDDDAFLSALRGWIDRNFDEIQLKRLRVKIRAERSRRRNARKQITIDFMTHSKLSHYAKSHNVTLSEAIERLLHLTTSENKPF